MDNLEFLSVLKQEKLVVVVRGNTSSEAIEIAKACIKGGVKLIEITFTIQGAEKVIAELSKKYKGSDVVIGAGTVLDNNTASVALSSGAEFIVSPDFNPYLGDFCNTNNIAYCPGVFTPTEIATALRVNCKALKLFPGDIIKPQGLKALKGPFPKAIFMVTGGVNYENINEWFLSGATAIGAGSNLTAKAKLLDYEGVTKDAALWVSRIKEIS